MGNVGGQYHHIGVFSIDYNVDGILNSQQLCAGFQIVALVFHVVHGICISMFDEETFEFLKKKFLMADFVMLICEDFTKLPCRKELIVSFGEDILLPPRHCSGHSMDGNL